MVGLAISIWAITMLLGTVVFVPLLIIALVRFERPAIAFAVSAAFSIGAMVGFFLSWLVAWQVIPSHINEGWNGVPLFVFVSAGAIGGAALALWLLRKLAGNQNWRR
jgi:hypothetical protein